jgi:hypothetical protein
VIHWIWQAVLHYADAQKSLADFQSIIKNLCEKGDILNKEQIINILCHIESLIYENTMLTTKRE